MSCPLLDQVFAAAGNQAPALPLQIGLGILKGGIIIAGSMPTISGSGESCFTPLSPGLFYEFTVSFLRAPHLQRSHPLHRKLAGTGRAAIPSTGRHRPDRVAFLFAGSYSVSLSTSAGAAIPISDSFEPTCKYIFGDPWKPHRAPRRIPVNINLVVHPRPL